jgi:hypothetical protein
LTAVNYAAGYYSNDKDYQNSASTAIPPPTMGYAAQGYTGAGNLDMNGLPVT